MDNVILGPWIHVSGKATNFDVVRDGDELSTRGLSAEVCEQK